MSKGLRSLRFCPHCTMPTRSFHSLDGRGGAWYSCASPWCGLRSIGPHPSNITVSAARPLHSPDPVGPKGRPKRAVRKLTSSQVESLGEYARRRLKVLTTRFESDVLTRTVLFQGFRGRIKEVEHFEAVVKHLSELGTVQLVEVPRSPGAPGMPPVNYKINL